MILVLVSCRAGYIRKKQTEQNSEFHKELDLFGDFLGDARKLLCEAKKSIAPQASAMPESDVMSPARFRLHHDKRGITPEWLWKQKKIPPEIPGESLFKTLITFFF